MKQKKMTQNKIISIMLKIMDRCGFRVGNQKYEKLYGSHGLSTIQKKHVTLHPKNISISFIGKKKVLNSCHIEDPKIIEYIHGFYASCSHPQEYLFKYGKTHITMKDINSYLKEFGFTCKDLRTWNANITFLTVFKSMQRNHLTSVKERKKIVKECIAQSAMRMHHTPTIFKSSYLYKPLLARVLESDTCIHEIIKTTSMEKYMRKVLSTSNVFP
jgi:DNA topoisomerase-1